jgi:hypothetical protein
MFGADATAPTLTGIRTSSTEVGSAAIRLLAEVQRGDASSPGPLDIGPAIGGAAVRLSRRATVTPILRDL